MFGSSQAFSSPAGAAPEKKARVEEKQTCVPVTVRIIHDATAAAKVSESPEVLIHGSEAYMVHLVGVVESFVEQTAMLEFQLNDASGRIKVRHYVSGTALGERLSGISAGRYVSVIGNLRTSPAPHISAMSLRAVSSADEVSYHMIEAALATLRLRSPAASGGLALTAGVTPTKRVEGESMISPMKVDAPVQVVAPETVTSAFVQAQPSTDLRSVVLKVLREEKDKVGEKGVELAAIFAKCQASSSKVQELMTKLVDEGEVITTIDDEHFEVI